MMNSKMESLNEKWQTKVTSISHGISYLYDTKVLADAVIVVKGHPFKVHKLVLASRSSEFARQLLSHNAVDEIVVNRELPITKDGFEVLLHFIYKNTLNTANKRLILEGYICAKHYKQRAMQIKCEEEIELWALNISDIFDLLDMVTYVPMLKDKCNYFILNNAVEVISSDGFKKASFKSLCAIVESKALEHIPNLQRIECFMKWGENRHTPPVKYDLIRQDLTPAVFDKLGFDRLKLEELSKVVKKYPGLLEPTEVVTLMSGCVL